MIILSADPSPMDLSGWRERLAWLHSQPATMTGRADKIADAKLQISLLEKYVRETSPQGD